MKERINEKTPGGGDYSEIIYLNNNNQEVDKEKATKAVIREMTADGTLINETFMNVLWKE
jgi:hypothetical protein